MRVFPIELDFARTYPARREAREWIIWRFKHMCAEVNSRVEEGDEWLEILLAKVNPQDTAEQAMESGTRTYRLNSPLEKPMQYMKKMVVESVLVTTSDGKLFGLLKREDVEDALSKQEKQEEMVEHER